MVFLPQPKGQLKFIGVRTEATSDNLQTFNGVPVLRQLFSQPKNRSVAVIIALLGTVIPLPMAGLHKFYLGQPAWGLIYLLLGWSTPIPRIACAIDAVWYLVQDGAEFQRRFNLELASNQSPSTLPSQAIEPNQMVTIAETLRQLDQLREDGLVSEYEFEQKRRQLLNRIR